MKCCQRFEHLPIQSAVQPSPEANACKTPSMADSTTCLEISEAMHTRDQCWRKLARLPYQEPNAGVLSSEELMCG